MTLLVAAIIIVIGLFCLSSAVFAGVGTMKILRLRDLPLAAFAAGLSLILLVLAVACFVAFGTLM